MELTLSADEARLLHEVVERALGDLRAEIAKTESYDWRQSMHADEERLKAILVRLESRG